MIAELAEPRIGANVPRPFPRACVVGSGNETMCHIDDPRDLVTMETTHERASCTRPSPLLRRARLGTRVSTTATPYISISTQCYISITTWVLHHTFLLLHSAIPYIILLLHGCYTRTHFYYYTVQLHHTFLLLHGCYTIPFHYYTVLHHTFVLLHSATPYISITTRVLHHTFLLLHGCYTIHFYYYTVLHHTFLLLHGCCYTIHFYYYTGATPYISITTQCYTIHLLLP